MLFNTIANHGNSPDTSSGYVNKHKKTIAVLLSFLLAGILFTSACDRILPIDSNMDTSRNESDSMMSVTDSGSASENGSDPVLASSGDTVPTPTNAPTKTPTNVPTESIVIRYMYVNVDIANFRTAPSTAGDSSVIRQMHYQARVQLLLVVDEWSKVVTDDKVTGYIVSEFLSADMPQVKPTAIPVKALAKWPSVSTLDLIYHPVKLEDFIGRDKGTGYEPLKGITVILDPGHGGADPGAVYNGTVYEKTINLHVALETRTYLESMGATVVMTHSEDDKTYGLYYRNALINRYILLQHKSVLAGQGKDVQEVDRLIGLMDQVMVTNSDNATQKARGVFFGLGMNADIRTSMDVSRDYTDTILISIHCNIIVNSPSSNGIEIYYGTNSSIYQDEKKLLADENPSNPVNPEYQLYNDNARRKFAIALRDGVRTEVPEINMRGGNGLYAWNFCMIRENNLTSALIELGYLSNKRDREFLLDPANQKKMALGIANSVYNYYCVN